ncbi:hypothetical protein Val02_11760 [Virgisporangium aliadipatigenens]|uniref:Uncharacterized protein n=1 Tax=Virgisporangium aliadipatigenens TaxID=741659 RepID=A0A8J4DMY7_9ACTN|nr:hypothetical protein [Virgisporangium aliadipatigenens]GIJ44290.1 hypothetical protein Val02_11760 [Virgisporangium aliadipatigenens]
MRYTREERGEMAVAGSLLYGMVLIFPASYVAWRSDGDLWWMALVPVTLGALLGFVFPGPLLRLSGDRRSRGGDDVDVDLPDGDSGSGD